MKVLYKLLLMMLLISTHLNLRAKDSCEVSVKFKSYGMIEHKGCASFSLLSEKNCTADIGFKAFAIDYSDGGSLPYFLRINGEMLLDSIVCDLQGWQYVATKNEIIELKKGKNIIDIISPNEVIPMVSDVFIVDEKTPIYNRHDVLKSINHFRVNPVSYRVALTPPVLTIRDPVCRPGVAMNQAYSYTSVIPIYCNAGSYIYIYGPTPSDYTYGQDASTIDYNIYIFNEDPSVFSTSVSSQNKGILSWSAIVPKTGLYYALVEAKNNGEAGGVTILINGSAYRNLFASNTSFPVDKQNFNGGLYVTAPDSCYNIFTVNGRVGNSGNLEADPCLWLKSVGLGSPKIVAYNNDNIVPSDFNWGKNARIRTHLSDTAVYSVLLSSNIPAYFVSDTCDLYHSFWNNPDSTYISQNLYMPNLKYEDAIESGNLCADYNCIAWSAGINYDMIWLGGNMDNDIAILDSLYSNCEVRTLFGKTKRADSLPKYTREDATANNCTVIIWGKYKDIDSGELTITHASIKNYTDTVPHGYDWESKLGWGFLRIFHPKYSIGTSINDTTSGAYGEPILYYRLVEDSPASEVCNTKNHNVDNLLYEDIAENRVLVESVNFTESERQKISDKINTLTYIERDEFEVVYNAWTAFIQSKKHIGNISVFTESREYAAMKAFVISHNDAEYFLYDKFIEGDHMVSFLIRDLALANNDYKRKLWNDIMFADLPEGTIRNSKTNISLYIKNVLDDSVIRENDAVFDDLRKSNSDEFSVLSCNSSIFVDLKLPCSVKCSLVAYNLKDNSTYIILPKTMLERGEYQYNTSLPDGIYAVVYMCNENLNVKKVVVQ